MISGLEEAVAYVGGVPHELLFDQMKAVILEDHRHEGGNLLENAEFLRFARHWGFRMALPPKTKGKVERPVGYVRGNFVYGREFVGDADLDAQRLDWLDDVANRRVHRTIQVVPRERFESEERAQLLPLAERCCRPLVLPEERTRRRTLLHVVPGIGQVAVEQRGLAAYHALVEEVA